ncbi:aldose 1-epimerase [Algibacter aquimarinus]|uniref:Aldose 1-epimerase n=1 Tax=Algibacter aquimarinus TaxID=1136748 RepID=A0ABP9HNA7_9FLAO
MYTIKHQKEGNSLIIEHTEKSIFGKIYLDAGASLQELTLNNHKIIQDLSPLSYSNTYASSILFPFANRIKDGKYKFNNEVFQLTKNHKQEENAIHGFVYNKTFEIIKQEVNEKYAKVSLEYIENKPSIGFPFTYKLRADYTFSLNSVSLEITAMNTSKKAFPFTLGWHPYFTSNNLFNSTIEFISDEKIELGDRNITTGIANIKDNSALEIKDKQLDDCWILNDDKVIFKTPKYNLQFSASADNNFLQIYTPPKKNTIAIEPTTGVSDSFNNQIGLKVLEAEASYNVIWTLKIS